MRLPLTIRPMRDVDAPIVYDSWSGAMADELGIEDREERRSFKRAQKPVVDGLIARGKVFVANPRKDEREVMGWICVEPPDVLHFVFVKKAYRRGSVARQLVEHAGLPKAARASHSTSWGSPRIARLFDTLTHNPDLGAP